VDLASSRRSGEEELVVFPTHVTMGFRRGLLLRVLFFAILFGSAILGLYLYANVYRNSERNSDAHLPKSWSRENADAGESLSSVVWGEEDQRRRSRNDPRKQLSHKIVHLDLKGMPYRVKAYKDLFAFLKEIGVTGILLEYEDMFPYHGKLAAIANKEAYSNSDVKKILLYAKTSQLEVRSIFQCLCFGLLCKKMTLMIELLVLKLKLLFNKNLGDSPGADFWALGICTEA
jgi:hypothetical protein